LKVGLNQIGVIVTVCLQSRKPFSCWQARNGSSRCATVEVDATEKTAMVVDCVGSHLRKAFWLYGIEGSRCLVLPAFWEWIA
jgi:hypothetical protein